jgi:hypothetical protein
MVRLGLYLIIISLTACIILATMFTFAQPARAQNVSSAGSNWSSSWGFASASDRSISLQRAQAIRTARIGTSPSTIVNTTNYNSSDNRMNYIENITDQGGIHSDLHVGDAIGSNTNSVGSMNTGSTTIEIDGTGNIVDANNFADNAGCVDGSINTASSTSAQPLLPGVSSGSLFNGTGVVSAGAPSGLAVAAQTCK